MLHPSPLVGPRAAPDMWWMLLPRWIWFLTCVSVWMELQDGVRTHITYTHAGICPNDMNPNLWVDAMSTCTRECESDQVTFVLQRVNIRLSVIVIMRFLSIENMKNHITNANSHTAGFGF